MKLKAKVDENGFAVLKDGCVVMEDESGGEVMFASPETVSSLHAESAKHRHKAKDLEKALAAFEGIDPANVRELEAFKASHKDTAKQMDSLKQSLTETYEGKIAEKDKVIAENQATIRKLSVSNKFAGSKYLAENTLLPAEIAEAYFGSFFEVGENGEAVAKLNGAPIYSRKKPGEIASFDEAIQIIIDQSPYRDSITRDPGQGGGGANPGERKSHTGGQINPWKAETRNLTMQSKIAAENPTLAAKFKAEAGIQ